MILEKQTENLELNDGVSQESFVTEIDFDSADFLKQMLSKFYADSIGSLVRETASNALDSHREAGIEEPIIVSLNNNSNGSLEFSVEDFGVGVDKDTINNILRKYGKSTKRNSVNQLGAFGLGWKSPLAYSSSFHFIGRKNGVETSCIMYEGEEDIKIDILYEKPTKERNGCKVIVPVKGGDRCSFDKKIQSQLSYFENVYFNVKTISNSFNIYRSDNFQYSEMCEDSCVHICLDNVYYPIDFDKLGVDRIYVPIGLKFSLTDGLFPTPNRESLKYTEESKQIIKAKLEQVANDLVSLYNKSTTINADVFKLIEHFSYSHRYISIVGEVRIEIFDFVKNWATDKIMEPELPNLTILSTEFLLKSVKRHLLREYEKEYDLYRGKITQVKHFKDVEIKLFTSNNVDRYLFSERFSGIKKEYIRHLYNKQNKSATFIKKHSLFVLKPNDKVYNENNLYYILGLRNIPRSNWRAAITDFYYVRDLIIKDKFIDLDNLQVPQSYLDDRKANRAKKVMNKLTKQVGEVVAKLAMNTQKSTNNYCKFESFNLTLEGLYKKPIVYIYALDEQKDKMDKLFSLLKSDLKDRYQIITFSNREYKKVEELKIHNLISIDKFMKGDTTLFKKIATAQLIRKLNQSNFSVFDRIGKIILEKVNKDLSDKITKLNDYLFEYGAKGDETLITAILEIAENNNLYDNDVYNDYLEVKALLEKLYFLNNYLQAHRRGYFMCTDECHEVRALVDLFKYHKVKVDVRWYSVPKIEPELLTELENA